MNTPSSLKILAAAALLATSFQARAVEKTWLNTGNITWGNGTNWSGGVAPVNSLTTDTVLFNAGNFTQPTPGTTSIAGVTVGDGATSTGPLNFTSGGLTVGASGILVKGNGSTGIGQVQMNAVNIGASQTWTNNGYNGTAITAALKTGTVTAAAGLGATTLTLNGTGTSGSTPSVIDINNFSIDLAGIVSEGAGTTLSLVVQTTSAGLVSLNAANTFSGGLAVKSGVVKFATATSAGTGTITLGDSSANANNAQLMLGVSGTMANVINVASGTTGTLTIGGLVGNTYSSVYSGAVTMANNLTIAGYGAATPGNNMFGTVMSGGFTGSGNLTLNTSGNGTVTISSNPVNMIGSITNNGTGLGTVISSAIGSNVTGVTQNSTTSYLVLTGANTYTGPTTITAGTLYVGNGTADGSIASSSGVTDNGLLVYNLVGSQTYANTISGTGNLTKTGAGTLILSGNNTYAGRTTISGGTLQLNRATGSLLTSSNVTVGGALGGGGKFNVDNTGATTSLATAPGTLTLGLGDNVFATTRTADFDQAVTFSSITANATHVTGATATFMNSGSTNSATNGFVLSGVTANNFIDKSIFYGTTAANTNYAWYDTAGYVRAINYGVDAGANSATSGTTATLASKTYQQITGAITAQGNATFTTFNINGNNDVALTTGTTFSADSILKNGSAGNATISGGAGIKASNNAELVINTASSGDNLILTTPILGNGTNALTKAGAGTLTLNGANTINGTTTIAAGNLTIGSAGTVNAGAYSGAIQNYGTLNYTSSANQSLTGAISGTGSINKTGTSNLTLGNGGSTFSGGVNLNQGTLTYGSVTPIVGNVNNVYKIISGALGTGTLTVAGGTSLNWTSGVSFQVNNMVVNGDFTLASASPGARFSMQMPMVLGSATRTATITSNTTALSAGSITGNSTLGVRFATISGNLSASSVDSGTLRFVGTGVATPGNATTNTFSALGFSNNVDFTNNAGLTIGSGVLASFGGSNLLGSTPDKYASLTVESGGIFSMSYTQNATATSNNQTVNSLSGAGIVTNLSTNATVFTSILTVAGNGTNTTFSGQIVDGVALNSTTNMTSTGLVALVKSGTGSLTLNGTNTYTGGTTINAGTLGVGNNSALGTGNITGAGGSLQAVGADATLSNNMTLAGTTGLTVSGSQNLTLLGTLTGNGSAQKTLINNLDPGKLLTLGNVVINAVASTQSLYIAGTGNTTVTGVISNGGNITNVLNVTNTGTTIFSGNNTYTGVTSLGANGASAGTLQLVGSGTLGANATAGLNVFGGTLDLGNKTLGVGTLTMGNGTVGTTANILIGSGNLTLNGNVAYNSTVNDNGATISGVGGGVLTLAADRTFTVADSTAAANDLTISAIIANGNATARALTKAGNGTLLLTAANTYTGNTTVNAGTLTLGHAGGTIADSGNVTVTGANAILNVAQDDTVGAVTVSSNGTISGTGTLNASSYLHSTGGNAYFLSSLAGSGNLTSTYSLGTVVLSGNNTAWSGVAAIGNTSLIIGHKNALGTNVLTTSGTMQASVDLSGANAIGTSVVVAGGTATGSNNMTFSGNFTNSSGSSYNSSLNAGKELVLSGNIYLSDNATGKTLGIAGTGNTTISGVIANSANGSFAGAGALTITNTGLTTLTGANTYNGTTTVGASTAADAGILRLSGAGKINGAVQVYGGTLDINGTTQTITTLGLGAGASGSTAIVSIGAGVLNLGGSITYTPGAGNANGATISGVGGGVLNLNGNRTIGVTDSTAAPFDVTISAIIANGSAPSGITKNSGNGTLLLSGLNTYNGTITVQGGALAFANVGNVTTANALGMSSNAAASILLGNATTLQYTGAAASTDRLFSINGVVAGEAATLDASGTGAINFTNTGAIAYGNSGQNRTLTLSGTNTGSNTLAPAIANNGSGVVSVTKSGVGTWVLAGNNTYTGGTTLTGGVLNLGVAQGAGGGPLGGNGTVGSVGIIKFTGGTLQFSAANTTDYSSRFSGAGSQAFKFDTNGQNVSQGSLLASTGGSFTKLGAGTLTVTTGSSSYDGATTISGGTLNVNTLAAVNTNSSIGKGSAGGSAADLVFDGGTLQYTGSAAQTTDRLFTVTANGGSIDASGSNSANPMTFTGTGSLAASGTGSRALTLTGSNTGLNSLAGILVDPSSGTTGLTKSGAGTWVLAGANTYTGTTTVSAGTLLVNGSTVAGSAFTVTGGSAAVLGGTGTINGPIGFTTASGGILAAGGSNAVGILITGAVSASITSNIKMELSSASSYDILRAASVTATNFTLDVTKMGGMTFANGQSFNIFQTQAGAPLALSGTFGAVNLPDLSSTPGLTWDSTQLYTLGTLNVVPEPSTWALLAFSLTTVMVLRRRKQS